MLFRSDETKRQYKQYIKESDSKCYALYHCSIQDLYNNYDSISDEQKEFLFWYERKMPVGIGNCSMNQICRYVESELDGYKSQLHKSSSFDYNTLKVKRRCTEEHRQALKELEQYYCECVAEYKKRQHLNDKMTANESRKYLCSSIKQKAMDICPNDDEIGRACVGKECRSRWSPYH